MTLFKDKYRVESARLQSWGYSSPGYYYVTICTKDRAEYFGEIRNGIMGLNEIGIQAVFCIQKISSHFPHVILDEWIIMPNHIHLVIIIKSTVETQNFASLQNAIKPNYNKFGPQSKNLASIIRGFKIGVTKFTRNNNVNFQWQPRYYDHIIRNDNELYRIRKYIKYNPLKWEIDRNNPNNI